MSWFAELNDATNQFGLFSCELNAPRQIVPILGGFESYNFQTSIKYLQSMILGIGVSECHHRLADLYNSLTETNDTVPCYR